MDLTPTLKKQEERLNAIRQHRDEYRTAEERLAAKNRDWPDLTPEARAKKIREEEKRSLDAGRPIRNDAIKMAEGVVNEYTANELSDETHFRRAPLVRPSDDEPKWATELRGAIKYLALSSQLPRMQPTELIARAASSSDLERTKLLQSSG